MRRLLTTLCCAAVAGLVAAAPVAAQEPVPPPDLPELPAPTWNECFQGLAFPGPSGEIYGPTDVNATSANGRMAVGLNREGTITVLRYPRPSYHDQVKYRTSSREHERWGALANEGVFLGLLVPGEGTTWLRDVASQQRYLDDRSDTIATTHDVAELGVEVVVTDTVAADTDALVRHVEVRVVDRSRVPDALEVVAFENLNLTVNRLPYFPVMDWCADELNVDTASWHDGSDAIVHTVTGVDQAAGAPASVAMAIGFDRSSSQHQVGGDAHEGTALPAGQRGLPTVDAHVDAADGTLSGNDTYSGQTTGAVTAAVDTSRGRDRVSLVLAGGADAGEATATLDAAREVVTPSAQRVVAAKRAWFDRLVGDAPMPATDDPAVLALSRRAVVTLASVYDRGSGAVVASITTQSPYGEDWPRDGAFFNHALDLVGRHDWVGTRLRWYADLQSDGSPGPTLDGLLEPVVIPPGNWAMNYYADGVVGGPIPWEIDETGYMLWAFWDHVRVTGDLDVLRDVYPAVQRAADFLTQCVDPTTGLHCPAIEDDNPQPRQTIHGAGPIWLGMDSAVKAARALGEDRDADRWAARRDELGAAIDEHLAEGGVYGGGNGVIVWPVCLHAFDDPRFADAHYDAVWRRLAPTFRQPAAGPDGRVRGLYESKGLLALAKATRDLPGWDERVRDGLRWVATEHAEHDTHVMGEEWLYEDGDVVSAVSQPHVWEQVLFYLAAIEAWPPDAVDVEGVRDCEGAVGRLQGTGGVDSAGPEGRDAPVASAAPQDGGARSLPATGGGSAAAVGLLALAGSVALTRRTGARRGDPFAA